MPRGTEVGLDLGPCDIVLDGDPAPLKRRHSTPVFFGPSLLWPNGRPSQILLSACCFFAKYCDKRVVLSVRTAQNHTSKVHQISCTFLTVAVTRSSYGDNAICYVLPVLRMTSCLPIIDQPKATPMIIFIHRNTIGSTQIEK